MPRQRIGNREEVAERQRLGEQVTDAAAEAATKRDASQLDGGPRGSRDQQAAHAEGMAVLLGRWGDA